MLALVSVDNKELAPLLAAHIYTVCPTAIPTLPRASSDASEEEFMESLGMLKGKDGEFETFQQFLHRTEVRASKLNALAAFGKEISPSLCLALTGNYFTRCRYYGFRAVIACTPGRSRGCYQMAPTIPCVTARSSSVSTTITDRPCVGRFPDWSRPYACEQASR